MRQFSKLIGGVFLLALVASGCGTNPLMPSDNGGASGRDTIVVVTPPDTTRPPNPPGNGGCGEINTGDFNVTRSQPLKYLYSYYFSGPFAGRMFARIENYREGGGHTNQDIQFYAVRDGDGMTIVIKRDGDGCGVLSDTTGVSRPVTRYVGQADLPAGAWTFYAVHGSRVDCWTQSGSGNGPVDVIDTQFEWCYKQ